MSPQHSSLLFQLLALLYSTTEGAFPAGLRSQPSTHANTISEVVHFCDATILNVTITMKQPFKGVVFAKDFPKECNVSGASSSTITIHLSTSSCGVSLVSVPNKDGTGNGASMSYRVRIVIQQDRHLRQITDLEREIECPLSEEAFLVRSAHLANVLREDLKAGEINHRVGRMKDVGWSKDLEGIQLEEELEEALAAARAWMEVSPSRTLNIGEIVVFSIKSTLPAGVGWRVTDCIAYDGVGDDLSQRLIDDVGCPVSEYAELLSTPIRYSAPRPIALMRHQEASAEFRAFKFPDDRETVHLKCSVHLCKGPCPEFDCDVENLSENRTGKRLSETINADIIDRLEVFNSMEVVYPEIDDFKYGDRYRSSESGRSFPPSGGDHTVCVSADKMAVAFCALGIVFLIAVAVAAVGLLRSRRSGHPTTPYYTRSLFSSSDSGGSLFGSKLLLSGTREPSPPLEHGTGRLQYGRIL